MILFPSIIIRICYMHHTLTKATIKKAVQDCTSENRIWIIKKKKKLTAMLLYTWFELEMLSKYLKDCWIVFWFACSLVYEVYIIDYGIIGLCNVHIYVYIGWLYKWNAQALVENPCTFAAYMHGSLILNDHCMYIERLECYSGKAGCVDCYPLLKLELLNYLCILR